MATRVTTNDLLDALREFGKAQAKRPAGEDWRTLDEMAAEESKITGNAVTRPQMRYRLLCAQRRGVKIETASGTALDEDGRAKRTTYYRLRNGKP